MYFEIVKFHKPNSVFSILIALYSEAYIGN